MSTINGLNFATAKRAVEFAFEDNDILVIKNNQDCGFFDVYLKDKAEKKSIKKLKTTYSCFRIFLVTIKETE